MCWLWYQVTAPLPQPPPEYFAFDPMSPPSVLNDSLPRLRKSSLTYFGIDGLAALVSKVANQVADSPRPALTREDHAAVRAFRSKFGHAPRVKRLPKEPVRVAGPAHMPRRATCDVPDIPITPVDMQDEVDMASPGGEVERLCFAAGTSPDPWDDAVRVGCSVALCGDGFYTPAVEILGAGAMPLVGSATSGGTEIVLGASSVAISGWESAEGHIRVANIKFSATTSSTAGSFGAITFTRVAGLSGRLIWKIDHNDFEVTPVNAGFPWRAISSGAYGGLIYRNKFINHTAFTITTNQEPIQIAITDDGSHWESDETMGDHDVDGNNNVYVETNEFHNFAVSLDCNTSCRAEWRFNMMYNSGTGDHGYDSSAYGLRHLSIHNNTFICTDADIQRNAWITRRGGTGVIAANTFAAFDEHCSYPVGGAAAMVFSQFKAIQCNAIGGWPGIYPSTYPIYHQLGWGWISGSNTHMNVGAAQGQGGGDQVLQPIYVAGNTINSATDLVLLRGPGECRLMAYTTSAKTMGSELSLSGYMNDGQRAFVVVVDLVGGTDPTIEDNCSGTAWTALNGGTNGSMRLTAFTKAITCDGQLEATITLDSSSSARAAGLYTMRSVTGVDKNPAVATDNVSPYTPNATTTLSSSTQLVVTYGGLQGPTVWCGNVGGCATTFNNDDIDTQAPSVDTKAISGPLDGFLGWVGTTGGMPSSNVSLFVNQRVVTTNDSVQPEFKNTTANRNGLIGVVTFPFTGGVESDGAISALDLLVTDVLQPDREYFNQVGGAQVSSSSPFDGTTGTGFGTLANRPITCTQGVGYWATDQGSWNTSGSGGQGKLYTCGASNNWLVKYGPYTYPHDEADETGEDPEESQTPGATASSDQLRLSASDNISLSLAVDDSVIALATGSVTLTGTAVDADMDALTYAWRQVAGPHTAIIADADQAETLVTFSEVGYYAFELTVTDGTHVTTKSIAVKVDP